MTRQLKEYAVTFKHDGNGYTITVYTFTKKAARESVELYCQETQYVGALITQIRQVSA